MVVVELKVISKGFLVQNIKLQLIDNSSHQFPLLLVTLKKIQTNWTFLY